MLIVIPIFSFLSGFTWAGSYETIHSRSFVVMQPAILCQAWILEHATAPINRFCIAAPMRLANNPLWLIQSFWRFVCVCVFECHAKCVWWRKLKWLWSSNWQGFGIASFVVPWNSEGNIISIWWRVAAPMRLKNNPHRLIHRFCRYCFVCSSVAPNMSGGLWAARRSVRRARTVIK